MQNENEDERISSGILHETKDTKNRNNNQSIEEFRELTEEVGKDKPSAEVCERLWKSPRTEQELDGGTKQCIQHIDAYNRNVVKSRVKMNDTADILREVIGSLMPFFDRSDWISFVQCCKVVNRASKDVGFIPRWPLCGLITIKKELFHFTWSNGGKLACCTQTDIVIYQQSGYDIITNPHAEFCDRDGARATLCFTPDDLFLLSVGNDYCIKLWTNNRPHTLVKQWDMRVILETGTATKIVSDVIISSNSQFFAVRNGFVIILKEFTKEDSTVAVLSYCKSDDKKFHFISMAFVEGTMDIVVTGCGYNGIPCVLVWKQGANAIVANHFCALEQFERTMIDGTFDARFTHNHVLADGCRLVVSSNGLMVSLKNDSTRFSDVELYTFKDEYLGMTMINCIGHREKSGSLLQMQILPNKEVMCIENSTLRIYDKWEDSYTDGQCKGGPADIFHNVHKIRMAPNKSVILIEHRFPLRYYISQIRWSEEKFFDRDKRPVWEDIF